MGVCHSFSFKEADYVEAICGNITERHLDFPF